LNCHQKIVDEIVAHARREVPGECCGVLIGNATAIVEAIPTRNLSDNQNRFLIDPQGHMAALRRARALGLEVVGFYHSHPHSAAVPSARDLDEAAYPDLLMMIVSVQSIEADVRLYSLYGTSRMTGDRFEAVELATDATDRNPERHPAGA
jgi:proteasome lid subunit RPN8/RPN11